MVCKKFPHFKICNQLVWINCSVIYYTMHMVLHLCQLCFFVFFHSSQQYSAAESVQFWFVIRISSTCRPTEHVLTSMRSTQSIYKHLSKQSGVRTRTLGAQIVLLLCFSPLTWMVRWAKAPGKSILCSNCKGLNLTGFWKLFTYICCVYTHKDTE